jgi:hypothetical protein
MKSLYWSPARCASAISSFPADRTHKTATFDLERERRFLQGERHQWEARANFCWEKATVEIGQLGPAGGGDAGHEEGGWNVGDGGEETSARPCG